MKQEQPVPEQKKESPKKEVPESPQKKKEVITFNLRRGEDDNILLFVDVAYGPGEKARIAMYEDSNPD